MNENLEPRTDDFQLWYESMRDSMSEFDNYDEAVFALVEELFDSAYQINEDRIKAALLFLMQNTDISAKLLYSSITVMHKYQARKQKTMSFEQGYKDAMKKKIKHKVSYLDNEMQGLIEKQQAYKSK